MPAAASHDRTAQPDGQEPFELFQVYDLSAGEPGEMACLAAFVSQSVQDWEGVLAHIASVEVQAAELEAGQPNAVLAVLRVLFEEAIGLEGNDDP